MLVLWLTFAPSVLEFEHLKRVIKYNQVAMIQHILGGASWGLHINGQSLGYCLVKWRITHRNIK
jgi:hypothetical protein